MKGGADGWLRESKAECVSLLVHGQYVVHPFNTSWNVFVQSICLAPPPGGENHSNISVAVLKSGPVRVTGIRFLTFLAQKSRLRTG